MKDWKTAKKPFYQFKKDNRVHITEVSRPNITIAVAFGETVQQAMDRAKLIAAVPEMIDFLEQAAIIEVREAFQEDIKNFLIKLKIKNSYL